ncbi:histone-lysine N-methyltransferase SETMAR [Trichonephila clavipes]|nr:histone-lysine N-methyltransferase SETMAR [Trichonephila clavipes]
MYLYAKFRYDPAIISCQDSDNFVRYDLIGPHKVAVPTHFFKSAAWEVEDGKYDMIAYVVPHKNQKVKNLKPFEFFLDKGENASQVAEIVNGVYGADTVTTNYLKFWFRRFRSSIFDVKDAPQTGRPVTKNVEKITNNRS